MLDKRFIRVILELVTTEQYKGQRQRKIWIKTMALNEVLNVAFENEHSLKENVEQRKIERAETQGEIERERETECNRNHNHKVLRSQRCRSAKQTVYCPKLDIAKWNEAFTHHWRHHFGTQHFTRSHHIKNSGAVFIFCKVETITMKTRWRYSKT